MRMTIVIAVVMVTLLGLARVPLAQGGADPVRKIGVLAPYSAEVYALRHQRLRGGLSDLGYSDFGYVEGRDIHYEIRLANGELDRLSALATELVAAGVSVIVTFVTPAAHAARAASARIPIVMAGIADPLATGLVSSLQRPGGNITGLSLMLPELAGKRLDILREGLPGLTRVAFLSWPADPAAATFVAAARAAGARLGVDVFDVPASGIGAVAAALEAARSRRADAVMVQPIIAIVGGAAVAGEAVRRGLPSISDLPGYAHDGGLLSYGPDDRASGAQLAGIIDQVLKGADPGEIPIQLPTRFRLIVNLRTAKALGLTLAPAILARADEVIE